MYFSWQLVGPGLIVCQCVFCVGKSSREPAEKLLSRSLQTNEFLLTFMLKLINRFCNTVKRKFANILVAPAFRFNSILDIYILLVYGTVHTWDTKDIIKCPCINDNNIYVNETRWCGGPSHCGDGHFQRNQNSMVTSDMIRLLMPMKISCFS